MTAVASMSCRLAGIAACALVCCAAAAQTPEAALADIRATYAFEPSTMTFKQQAERVDSLSALWKRFTGNPGIYRPALHAALTAEGAGELLYCDGGMLLIDQSAGQEDIELGVRSIARCAMAEIEHTPYFYTMHKLARGGMDTFELQLRMLERPDYGVFIVPHALSLAQDYAFLYPLLLQDERRYVPKLVARLATERDATAQKTLVNALWYAALPESEAVLRRVAADAAAPAASRQHASKLLERTDGLRKLTSAQSQRILKAVGLQALPGESELREKRRQRMRAISDEALYDLDAYTALLYRLPARR